MDMNTYFKNLSVPTGKIDVVLDTDTFNEVDDQFAISYMLASKEKLNVKALYAAPFFNQNSTSPKDGMEKSYDEIITILKKAKHEHLIDSTFKGSADYLENEQTPQLSDAAQDLAKRAELYSPENPLYVVAIGAITNIASALLINPEIKNNIVVVWLGGHALEFPHTKEFNMYQDVAAARVVFGCGCPLIHLPAMGVVSEYVLPYYEMEHFMKGKNELCDFLLKRVHDTLRKYHDAQHASSRIIWDVTAIGWLLNDSGNFMSSKLIHSPVPEYDYHYSFSHERHLITYVYKVFRDNLATDMYKKLAESF